ncbi:MAG: alpha/beta hydrolase [Deltaproteobacteria bacterium]|nr:alpha/beta hydrolase [Deltaproteobacteria bacterium]MBW2531145.1 alpha/beta hydrolase [Deltaproteobacteria bacterium]
MAQATIPSFILLPGLDGTGRLFEPFCAVVARAQRTCSVVRLPSRPACDYRQLADRLGSQLDLAGSVLVAESFSGPLALELAANHGAGSLAGVVLVASFVRPPVARLLRWLPWRAIFATAPPNWAIRRYLVGGAAPAALVAEVRSAVATVEASVLAQRVQAVLTADATEQLATCATDVLYLQATQDRLVRQPSVDAITQTRSDVAVVQIEAPHLLLQTRPKEAWAAIERWLAPTPSSRDSCAGAAYSLEGRGGATGTYLPGPRALVAGHWAARP